MRLVFVSQRELVRQHQATEHTAHVHDDAILSLRHVRLRSGTVPQEL